MLKNKLRQIGLNRPIFLGALTAIRRFLTSPVTALLIAAHFTPQIQGYYYTFSSLLALQVFAELGLSQVVVQFTSHEWGHLSISNEGSIIGSPDAISRFVSIGRIAIPWYVLAGIAAGMGLGICGYIFFAHDSPLGIAWQHPWLALCFITGGRLILTPFWSMIEGANRINDLYAFRLVDGVITTIMIWSAIAGGALLWTAPIAATISLVWNLGYLWFKYKNFFRVFLKPATAARIDWRHEMWPMQWRIALSWLSGYFCFSLFTPVLFDYQGPVEAGRMGMTWSLLNGLIAISALWITTKAPQFGALIGKKAYEELDKIYFRAALESVAVACCGATVLEMLVWLLRAIRPGLANRLLSPLPLTLFLIALVFQHISTTQAIYLRAHRKEPLLICSLVSSFLVAISVWQLGIHFGATGMAAGFLTVIAIVGLPWTTTIWKKCRAEWHQGSSSNDPKISNMLSLETLTRLEP